MARFVFSSLPLARRAARVRLWWSLPRLRPGFPFVVPRVPLFRLRCFCLRVSVRVALRRARWAVLRRVFALSAWAVLLALCLLVVLSVCVGVLLASPSGAALAVLAPLCSRSWVVRGGVGLGSLLGGFFGCRVCALRVCVRPASVRLVGRRRRVRLFPSAFGFGLSAVRGAAFPSFLVLPSGVLVPFCSVLVGSSFASPVCAGRVLFWCGSAAPELFYIQRTFTLICQLLKTSKREEVYQLPISARVGILDYGVTEICDHFTAFQNQL